MPRRMFREGQTDRLMARIAGIDFNTRTIDVVLIDEDTDAAEWHRFDITEDALTGEVSGDAFDRTRRVITAMPRTSWWEDQGVIAIGLEQPRGNYGVTPLFRIQGAILASLPIRILVQPWNPAEWRKAVGLPGNAPKQAVAELVSYNASYHAIDWPQDACDAWCIAYATRDALEREIAA